MTDRPTAYQSEPRDLTWLRPDPSNPNVHPPESIAAIAASIHAFGFDQPILATRDGRIIAGHGRYLAAQQLGYTQVPVVVTDLSSLDATRRLIGDNRIAELSHRDNDALATLLEQLRADDAANLAGTGYDDAQVDALLASLAPPSFEPVGIEEQGRLDQKASITCPHCHHEFIP